jgi:hypothetical protein
MVDLFFKGARVLRSVASKASFVDQIAERTSRKSQVRIPRYAQNILFLSPYFAGAPFSTPAAFLGCVAE